MMALRLPIAVLLGALFTTSMFWLLWHLVGGEIDVDGMREATRIDFSRMIQDTQVEVKRRKKIEREKPPPQQATPRLTLNQSLDIQNPITEVVPLIDTRGAMSRMSMGGGSDTDVLPLVRVAPEYPPRAQQRGLEGAVRVQFTITEQGTVKDAVVVLAEPEKQGFEEAALRAILRWRYKPMVVGGQAVERVGVQTIIRFELEDG